MNGTNHQPPNPFPGLRPFRSDEHHLFFGREEQTAALLQLLRTNRFLAVVGTSGSGKSSLVRAGMIAGLHGGTMTQAGSAWEVMILRPGGSPIENLARAFVAADLYEAEDPSTLPRLLATLNRSRFGLVEAMKQSELFEPGTNLLVVVDQFEELFRFRQQGVDSEETAAAFVNLLLTAAGQAECPVYVTITMRSDYLGDCSEIPGLAEAVNAGEYLIPRLLRDQKRDAIEKPIGVGGARISPLLVQRLLNEVGDDPDQLPVLQHALMRMWDAWSADGDPNRPIDFGDFEATGGLGAALSNHADEVYGSLPDDRHRSACARIFKTLTVKGDDNRGIRRPTRLARLQAIAEADRATVTAVLDAFRGSGVTFLMPGMEVALDDRTVLDLSHESLMRGWQRLRGWVEDEAQSARVFRRLLDTAQLWSDGKAGLFHDPDLQIALSWREREAPNAEWAEQYGGQFQKAIGFLEASHAEVEAERQAKEAARQRELAQAQELAETRKQRLIQQRRSARNLRKLIAGLAVVAGIAGVACVIALVANQRANTLAENARQNAERAERSQQETAKALATVASQKAAVEGSLSKAEKAERSARAAEEAGRKLLYTTDMRLAPFVWRDDRSTAEQLRVLLAKHIPDGKAAANKGAPAGVAKPDLRGFEWHYYEHLLERSATVFSGHTASVVGGAFTSDGQLMTLDEDGRVRRWDLASQAEDRASRRDLPGGPSGQLRVLSPNGRRVALAEGNKVRVFDTSTGQETFQINSANNQTRRLIFSRDGDRLVIVDNKIRWLSAVSGELIASVDQKFERIESLAFSADGLTLAVVGHGNMGGQFSIFRLDATAKKVTPLAKDIAPSGTLNASALTPDGRRIAVGAKLSGALFVYDTATGRPIAAHGSAHASPIAAMAFSGEGARLATADAEGTIKIWADVQKLTSKSSAFLTLKGHQGAITTIGFSSAGKRIVTTSTDKTARVWDLQNAGAAIRPLERPGGSFVARFSPDGQLIAAAGGKLQLFDAATGGLVRELPAKGGGFISSVAFSPTDHRLLAVGYGGRANVSHVELWDIDAGTQLARLPGATDLPGFPVDDYNSPVGALAFSPDGKYLVAGFGSKMMLTQAGSPTPLKVWEVATRRLIRRLGGHTGYCVAVDFSRDGKWLASGSRDGTAVIWSTATWKKAQTLQNPDKNSLFSGRGMVEDVAFSPNGKILALASREGTAQLWDVATGKPLKTLKGHSSAVLAVAFSPDGRTLASGGGDHTVRLWNVETRRQLMQLDPGGVELGQVQTLAFSPDGMHLLAGGTRTAFWSAAPLVWNDANRAAANLRALLQSNAAFQSRIRMLSENLRLHEALAKLDAKDVRVQAALAATRANWHASRHAWPEAVEAFDRLLAADPTHPEGWLRTPGLLRLATALLYQNRPRDAAALLTGGAKRREQDGVLAAADRAGLGFVYAVEDGTVRVTQMSPGFPGSRAGLVAGDTIVKVNDTELTSDSLGKLSQLLAGDAGTKVRLTVRHSGGEKQEVIELARERFVNDPATGDLLLPLRAAINERLAKEPRNPGLLELRAELAGQWSDAKAQAADYTVAIDVLSRQKAKAAAMDLKRLYGRRGNAYVALKQWRQAFDDYARVVTDATTDDALLSNQALAKAEVLLMDTTVWAVLKPTERNSQGGATLTLLGDNSILASGNHPGSDVYTLTCRELPSRIHSLRLEALTHDTLPNKGPGRHPARAFVLTTIQAELDQPKCPPLSLKFTKAWGDSEPADARPSHAIDAEDNTGWSPPEIGQPHFAVFEFEKPVAVPEGAVLRVTLEFKHGDRQRELGRFRLSVSRVPVAFDREQKRFAPMVPTDPWQKLAAAYRLQGKQQAIDQLVEQHPKLAGPIGDLFTQGKDEDKDWQRAVALYTKGITAETTDAELLSKRARAYEALRKWDAAAADWSRAATGHPEGAKLLAEFAGRLAAAGQAPLAKARFEKSQALYEQSLAADPDNDLVAPDLAQLLWDKHENEGATPWTVLKPVEAKSELGATLSILPDHSILASGANPRNDRYRVVLTLGTDIDLRAVRLEALTHPSLPGNGPGRTSVGSFAQTSWNVTAASRDRKDPIRLQFDNAWADHQISGYPMTSSGHWNIAQGGEGRDCTAVWSMSNPVSLTAGTPLTFEMQFKEWNGSRENLGRFRLSVSGDPATLAREQKRLAGRKLTPWARLAAGYAVNGRNEEASQYFSRALQQADGYEARKPILEFAARFDEVVAALSKPRPDDPQLQLALARQLAERGKQLLARKRAGKARVKLEKAREVFTRLGEGPKWAVLTPTEMKSQGGETLTVERDGSIFVSGPNPVRAVYKLKLRTDLPTLAAIRLETIPDARLPDGGAGRYGNGNFHVAEFTAAIVSGRADVKPIPIEFGSAVADVSQGPQNEPAKSIDGNPRTWWDTLNPRGVREAHWAVFVLKSPARMDGGSLRITLDSGITQWGYHGLGRFRLSVTSDADLTRALVRNDLKDSEVVDLCIALAKAHAQQGHSKKALASFTEALDLAGDRAGKAKIIAEAAPLPGVLAKLAERAAGDGQFQAELARYYAERGKAPLAERACAKARAFFEQKLAKEPKNAALAAELAEVLLIDSRAGWTLLKPTQMKSAGGATLTLLGDGSILSSGKHPERDDYTIISPTKIKNIRAIALDVLPDDSFGGAVGRGTDGQFIITQLEVSRVDRAGRRQPVPLADAAADFEQADWPGFVARNVVNGKNDVTTGWAVKPQLKTPHRLIVKPVEPVDAGTSALTFVIRHHYFNKDHKLGFLVGRFRLSVSDDPQAFEQERNRLAAMKLTDPFTKLATAYHVIGDHAALDKLLALHPAATAGIGDVYALAQDWKRALAEYTRAIADGSKDARTFAARAEVYEKLEKWELAAGDWASADASDKTFRYGTPPFLVLERRAQLHERLQQYEKLVLDCNELLKPERLGDSPWMFRLRGEAYDGLRQWEKARADHDQALKVCSPEERGAFHFFRGRDHFAAQGQWKQAALDMQQAYQKPADYSKSTWPRSEWWAVRDAALIFAVAGDVENYGKAAAECYRKQTGQAPNAEDSKWMVLTMLLFPEMITKENHTRLLELAGKTDAYWRPRLAAAIYFRGTRAKKAAQLFDANGGGPQFLFLAAMVQQKLGKPDRAKQLLEEGNSWVRQERAKDPKAGVPRGQAWHDWATIVTLQYEASDLILRPRVGPKKLAGRAVGDAQFQAALARHFAAHGNAPAAEAARAKACALFAEKLAKEPASTALAGDLFSAYQSAGRTKEAIPHLAKASAAHPEDTLLALKVAALQAWFERDKELAATRQRLLAFAKGTNDAGTAEHAAKACSIRASAKKAELEAALALAHKGVEFDKGGEWREWRLLTLGMAEYRCGDDAAAVEALLAAAKAGSNNPLVMGISAFYRAMSLFRQGKPDEARKLAIAAAAKMKPLPKDEQNPLANGASYDDLILWLAYKETKALIKFDAVPQKGKNDKK